MPLTSIAQEGDLSESSLSQFSTAALGTPGVGPTANRFALQLSSTAATPMASSGGPPSHSTVVATATRGKKQQQREQKKLEDTDEEGGGGFLSVLVSLVETVAGPLSPEQSRASARRRRREEEEGNVAAAIARASAGSFSEVETISSTSSIHSPSPTRDHMRSGGTRQAATRSILPAANGDGGRRDCREEGSGTSPSHGGVLDDEDDEVRKQHWVDPNRPVPQRGFGSDPPSGSVDDDYQSVVPAATVAAALAAVMSRPRAELYREPSLFSTASSIDPGEEEMMPLQREFGAGGLMKRGFPSEGPMKRGFGPR